MGRWSNDNDNPAFVLRPQYFQRARVEDTVERDGLRMTFRGWTYTLDDYAVALEGAGFTIETIREPTPVSASRFQEWRELPLFMNIRAIKW